MKRLALLTAPLALAAGAALPALLQPAGYGARIDAATLIGGPPAPGAATDRADRAAFAGPLPDPVRWRAAQAQVLQFGPEVTAQIGAALGHPIETAPRTRRLLGRALADLHPAVDAAKAHYARPRPFMVLGGPACDFRSLGPLGRSTGGTLTWSWPSGHAAQGRLIARVLADVAPGRVALLRAWGDGLGANRIVCRVHWPSDVAAGRRIADALHARLARLPGYRADVAAARFELAAGDAR